MLAVSTISFLQALKKNNNKEWFEKNRDKYEASKLDFENFVGAVLDKLKVTDPAIAELKPKDCTFRINRDVRFSKNKAPYKTNMAMYISNGGKKSNKAGYYLHLEPGSAFLAGGVWMPTPEDLKKIRQEIDYSFDAFKKILSASTFKKAFEDLEITDETTLVRAPKGYEEQNAAIKYIKLKSFIATTTLNDDILTSKELVKQVTTQFEILKPLIDFINVAVDD
jgi:uncharacterized protein (TIGR02453 family)